MQTSRGVLILISVFSLVGAVLIFIGRPDSVLLIIAGGVLAAVGVYSAVLAARKGAPGK